MEGNPPIRDNSPPYKQALNSETVKYVFCINPKAASSQNNDAELHENVSIMTTRWNGTSFELFDVEKWCF